MTNTCPICFDPLHDKQTVSPDVCHHVFCLECLEKWSKYETFCPVDRKRFGKIINLHSDVVIKVKPKKRKKTRAVYDITRQCDVCRTFEPNGTLILCDSCDLSFHCLCLDPPINHIPSGQWHCVVCRAVTEKIKSQKGVTKSGKTKHITADSTFNNAISNKQFQARSQKVRSKNKNLSLKTLKSKRDSSKYCPLTRKSSSSNPSSESEVSQEPSLKYQNTKKFLYSPVSSVSNIPRSDELSDAAETNHSPFKNVDKDGNIKILDTFSIPEKANDPTKTPLGLVFMGENELGKIDSESNVKCAVLLSEGTNESNATTSQLDPLNLRIGGLELWHLSDSDSEDTSKVDSNLSLTDSNKILAKLDFEIDPEPDMIQKNTSDLPMDSCSSIKSENDESDDEISILLDQSKNPSSLPQMNTPLCQELRNTAKEESIPKSRLLPYSCPSIKSPEQEESDAEMSSLLDQSKDPSAVPSTAIPLCPEPRKTKTEERQPIHFSIFEKLEDDETSNKKYKHINDAVTTFSRCSPQPSCSKWIHTSNQGASTSSYSKGKSYSGRVRTTPDSTSQQHEHVSRNSCYIMNSKQRDNLSIELKQMEVEKWKKLHRRRKKKAAKHNLTLPKLPSIATSSDAITTVHSVLCKDFLEELNRRRKLTERELREVEKSGCSTVPEVFFKVASRLNTETLSMREDGSLYLAWEKPIYQRRNIF